MALPTISNPSSTKEPTSLKSFTGSSWTPSFIAGNSGTKTTVVDPAKLQAQALRELLVVVSCAFQMHDASTPSGRTAIRQYFARKYNINLNFHPASPWVIKMKYTQAVFTWLWQLAARGVVLFVDSDNNFGVIPLLYAPMKTFNLGEYRGIYGGSFDLSRVTHASTKYDGSLIICTAGNNPRLPTEVQNDGIFYTTSGSFAQGPINGTNGQIWAELCQKVIGHDDLSSSISDSFVEWMRKNPTLTVNFELCTSDNHIVSIYNHGDLPGRAYLLGAFDDNGDPLTGDQWSSLQAAWIRQTDVVSDVGRCRRLAQEYEFSGQTGLDSVMDMISNDPLTYADCQSRPEGLALYWVDSDGRKYFVAKSKLDEYFQNHKLRSNDPGSHQDLIYLTTRWLENQIDDIQSGLIPVQLDYVDSMQIWLDQMVSHVTKLLDQNLSMDFPSIPAQLPFGYSLLHSGQDLTDVASCLKNWYLSLFQKSIFTFPLGRLLTDSFAADRHQWFTQTGQWLDDMLRQICTDMSIESIDLLHQTLSVCDRSVTGHFARLVNACFSGDFSTKYKKIFFSLKLTSCVSGWDLLEKFLLKTPGYDFPQDGLDASTSVVPVTAASSSTASSATSLAQTKLKQSRFPNGQPLREELSRDTYYMCLVVDFDGTIADTQALIDVHGHRLPESVFGPWFDNVVRFVQQYSRLGCRVVVVTGRLADLRSHIRQYLNSNQMSSFDLVAAPIGVQNMKTTIYKMEVCRMLESRYGKVMVVDDDFRVHRMLEGTSIPCIPVTKGTFLPPGDMVSPMSSAIVGVVGTTGSGKSSVLALVAKRLQRRGDRVVVISTDTMDGRVNRDVKPIPTYNEIDGVSYLVMKEDQDYVVDPTTKPRFDTLSMALKNASANGYHWIIVDSCNAQGSALKTLRANCANVKLFSWSPVISVAGKKNTQTIMPGSFLCWAFTNVVTRRGHANLDASKVDAAKIWSVLARKAVSAAPLISETISLISEVSYPTDWVINRKERKLDNYMNTLVKSLTVKGSSESALQARQDALDVMAQIAQQVVVPSTTALADSMFDHLTQKNTNSAASSCTASSSAASSSATKKVIVRSDKYRGLAVQTTWQLLFSSRYFTNRSSSRAVFLHVTLAMGGDSGAYEHQDLVGQSFDVALGDVEHATFNDGSWVIYTRVTVDHPMVPETGHITLAYHDVHSRMGGAYMSHHALVGHKQLKSCKTLIHTWDDPIIVGHDVFLPTGMNTM